MKTQYLIYFVYMVTITHDSPKVFTMNKLLLSKQTLSVLFTGFALLLLLLASCTPKQMPIDNQDFPDFLTVSGTITAIAQNGTDGDVWLLKTADDTTYEVLLSIPNLGETYSQYLKDVDIGTNIEVSGGTLKLNEYVRIIAKTLALK